MDELWAATYTQLGLKDLLVAVVRFDVHPPAYYVQMNAWAALFGRTDAALLANSVAWSLLTIVAVWLVSARLLSPAIGLVAAALTALSGSEVFYGQELRMYAMIGALTLLSWHLAERYIRDGTWAWLIAVLSVLALSHGASIVPISCVAVYLALRLGLRELPRPRHLALFFAIGVICLPTVVNSMFRGVSHTQSPDASMVGATVAGWLFGYHPPLEAWTIAAGAGIIALATVAALAADPKARPMVLAFIVWPVVFVLALSLTLRPIWIARLMAFCAPFACIALAAVLVRFWSRWRAPTLAVGLALAVTMTVHAVGQASDGRKMEYRETAAFLRDNARPGDLILVPEHVAFWGIARYFAGPSWGNLLAIQDPERPSESRAWDPVYARLGPEWLRWLNLIPEHREIAAHGTRLMIGRSPDPAMLDSPRIWLVGSGRLRPEDLTLCEPEARAITQFRGLSVLQWSCARKG